MEKEALFSLKDYRITESSFDFHNVEDMSRVHLSFMASGLYEEETATYTLQLEVQALNDGKKLSNVKLNAIYRFKDSLKLDEIPIFFYSNSIAIVFPYIRAFISTVSLQANIRPIIIPTLNIQPLGSILKENTILKNNNK